MQNFHTTDLGPRLISRSWAVHENRYGQWAVVATHIYDDGGRVYQMPQHPEMYATLDDALAAVPDEGETAPKGRRSGWGAVHKFQEFSATA